MQELPSFLVLSFKAGGAELEEFVTDIPSSEHPMPREP